MSTEIISLWPARVTGPEGEWGDQNDRARAFVYTKDDGTIRLVVLNAQGLILAATDVSEYRYNGTGMDVTDGQGREWWVVAIAGCTSCGGSQSASSVFQILQRGEEIFG